MIRILKWFTLLFSGTVLASVTGIATIPDSKPVISNPISSTITAAPSPVGQSTESALLTSILSAMGGVGGGGLLLIFLIKRFVTNYDETVKKWEDRFEKLNTEYSGLVEKMWERQEKIKELIESVKDSTNELKYEADSLKETMVTKDFCQMSKIDYVVLKAKLNEIEIKLDKVEEKLNVA